MIDELTKDEWQAIFEVFESDPYRFGLPKREYGSVVLASFNIRKLASKKKRMEQTWEFLARVCRHFDLLSIQEIQDDLKGFDYLKELMGAEFLAVVSDITGAYPGEKGLAERLGFIYNNEIVKRGNIVSDISIDRSRMISTLLQHQKALNQAIAPYLDPETGEIDPKAKIKLPVFLTFVRQPFCVSFRIVGHPGTQPYEIMAVNAHLYFGDGIEDRRQEFDALMEWIMERVREQEKGDFPNFVLMGDLNLDFDNPERDLSRIEKHIKTFDKELGKSIHVNFPFLDMHPNQSQPFRTNARLDETFDQIGLFSRDLRLPSYKENAVMGKSVRGPDYGVFNFAELFRTALDIQPLDQLSSKELREFYAKFEHEVSDHLPLWLRLPLPDV